MPTSRRCSPDLFGEIPVTVPDCIAWVEAVAPRIAGLRADRLARYIIDYAVPEKIARAKAAGTFEAIVAGHLQRDG